MSRRERKYAVGGTVQTYDFLWDGDDRLHQVKQGVSSRFSATYNGDGLRASKTDLFSATYHFTWGPGGVLYDGATTYTPGLAQRYGTTEPRYSHSDWVGSTRYLSESTGLLMPSALRYDAYGQRTALAGPNYPTPYQFAGGWGYEAEYSDATEPYLGLAYVDQRYYEPATGRFISPDPIGFDGGLNLFAYCDNDPVNSVDPSGLIHSLGGSREVPEGGGGGVSEEDELLFVFLIGLLEGMKDPAGMHAPLVPRLGRPGGARATAVEPEVGPGVSRLGRLGDKLAECRPRMLRGSIGGPGGGGGRIPWTSVRLQRIARALEKGEREVTVASRQEAEELFRHLYAGKGYRNTTGLTGNQVRNDPILFPGRKYGTYHWDVVDTKHGGRPHLQIHDEAGGVLRIFYSPK
jgi:RHS repeat-associated protein